MISWSSIAQTARSDCWLIETALLRFLMGETMIGALLRWSESESGGIAASSLEKSSCVEIWNTVGRGGVWEGSETPWECPWPPLNPLGGMVTGWASKTAACLLIWHDKPQTGADWCWSLKIPNIAYGSISTFQSPPNSCRTGQSPAGLLRTLPNSAKLCQAWQDWDRVWQDFC